MKLLDLVQIHGENTEKIEDQIEKADRSYKNYRETHVKYFITDRQRRAMRIAKTF